MDSSTPDFMKSVPRRSSSARAGRFFPINVNARRLDDQLNCLGDFRADAVAGNKGNGMFHRDEIIVGERGANS